MPNTSNPVSVSHGGVRARLATILSGMALTVIAVVGMWAATATDAARTHTVLMEGMKFSPASLHIEPGDRVIFRNVDLVPHTATARNAKIFDSGPIKPGESWTVSPPADQTIRYVCTYHPMMEGEIIAHKP